MRALILLLSVFVLVGAPLGVIRAQEPPATIPIDLALGLLDESSDVYGSHAPTITVGRAPDGFPSTLTSLQGANILGGLSDSRSMTLVLKATLPPNQVLTSFDKQLTASGWGPPPPPPDVDRGGFTSDSYSGSFGNLYCSDSAAVILSYSPAPRGGTYIKARYSRDRESSFCAPRRVQSMGLPALKFPILLPPRGMMQGSGGGGSGGRTIETRAELTGPLSPAEVIPHYVKQLEAAGWKMGSLASSGDVSVTSAEAKDPEGKLWRGALIAQRVGETELQVALKMAKSSP